jgi:hypothetical protein
MYISHKSNVLQTVNEVEWQCRRNVKGLDKSEYWTWLDSVTSGDPPVVDLSGETGYVIVECTDEDVNARLGQLGDYIGNTPTVYNIKWSDKKTKVTVDKVEIETHFTGDDSAKDARILADEWKQIRAERDRLLAETDWMMLSDTGTVSTAWKNYRKALREIPSSQDSAKVFSDIDWPDKPSS